MRAILIDAGHGLSKEGFPDNGAPGYSTTEREMVLIIAKRLALRLKQDAIPVFTIGVAEAISLAQHVSTANAICAQVGGPPTNCLLISIHMNAGDRSVRGVEAWHGTGKDPSFGETVAAAVAVATGIPRRQKLILSAHENRHGSLAILDKTHATSCLLECGFVTNPEDVAIVRNDLDKVCEGIRSGIYEFIAKRNSGSALAESEALKAARNSSAARRTV